MGVAFGVRPSLSSQFFPPSRPHNIARQAISEARKREEAEAERIRLEAEEAARQAAAAVLKALHRRTNLAYRQVEAAKQYRTRNAPFSMHNVAEQVGVKHGFTVLDLQSERKNTKLAWARFEAFFRCSTETKCSLSRIAQFFNRDHSTVIHGIIRYRDRKLAGEA